jgi:RNA polymerase sigma factor (TIGR02999 family)
VTDESANAPITELLERARQGDGEAFDRVFAAVYEELRRLARARRRRQSSLSNTLDTTALVHEVYLRLCQLPHPEFRGREHFLAVAALAMRQILVDEARRRLRVRRGGGARPEPLESVDEAAAGAGADAADRDAATVLDVHRALEALGRDDPRLEKVIVYRFFGGMTEPETAVALGLTDRTIRRDWIKARAWLRHHLDSPAAPA